MANVLFTTYCNRNCSYCFAKGKVDLGRDTGDPLKNLGLPALEKIIQFYKLSQLRRFVVLGGEPTLNPDFISLIDRITLEPSFKSIMIFTNGLMPEKVLDYLARHPDDRLKIAMNFNEPNDYSTGQRNHINKILSTLGKRVGLGINIYKPRQNYDYLINAITSYGLAPHVRVGLTQPIVDSKNTYAKVEDFNAIAEDLVAFAETAFRKKISFSFDCGFQFCMFTLDQHKELLRFGIKFKSVCSPIIDIGPDLSVWRCFPLLNHMGGKLTDFKGRNGIVDYYDERYQHLQSMGNRAECPECHYRKNKLCSGGCLARTLISFNRNGAWHNGFIATQ